MDPESVGAVLFTKRATWTSGGSKVKVEGVLTATTTRLGWKPNNPTAAQTVNINVGSITNQQRPTAKGKPFLKLVTAAQSHVFEFATDAERDGVVDILAPLIAQSVPEANSNAADPALCKRLLESNPSLRNLYTQLVDGGVLRAGEFWQGQQALLRREAGLLARAQRVGLSSAMLSDVQTSADGRTDTVKVRLTPEVIHQTFAEKPAVRRAYFANVPHNMSQKDFWTKYLRLQVKEQARRMRAASGANVDEEASADEDGEFFRRYERSEDSEPAPAERMRQVDPALNLAADQADTFSGGFGFGHNPSKEPATQKPRRGSLIRDINHHAEVVMEGVPKEMPDDPAITKEAYEAVLKKARDAMHATTNNGRPAERQRSEDGRLEDLLGHSEQELQHLSIKHPNDYFGATAGGGGETAADGLPADRAAELIRSALASICPTALAVPPLSSALALEATADMEQEVAAVSDADGPASTSQLLPRMEEVLRQSSLTANELLRHFWACFPTNSDARVNKLKRVQKGLSEQYDQIQGMQKAASAGIERIQVQQLMKPLVDCLEVALSKAQADQDMRHDAMRQAALSQPAQ